MYEQPEERAMREQREQAGRMPPKVYTAYENEMPVSERPRNYRSKSFATTAPTLIGSWRRRADLEAFGRSRDLPRVASPRHMLLRRRLHIVRDDSSHVL